MGFFGGFLFSKSEAWLKAERNRLVEKLEKSQEKSKTLKSKIDLIDKELKTRQGK